MPHSGIVMICDLWSFRTYQKLKGSNADRKSKNKQNLQLPLIIYMMIRSLKHYKLVESILRIITKVSCFLVGF